MATNHRLHRWGNLLSNQVLLLISEITEEILGHEECFERRRVVPDGRSEAVVMLELQPDVFFDLASGLPFRRVGGTGGAKNEPSYPLVRQTDFLDRVFLADHKDVWKTIVEHECKPGE